jgi:phosphoribosyl-ATP pyrophosphohydrolase
VLIVSRRPFLGKGTAVNDQKTILARLMSVIADRKAARPANSYTTQLLNGGVEAIGAKIREEAAEVVEAARATGDRRRQEIVSETADLVYHLLVMLACCDVTLLDVENELARRFGTSGFDEKASRGNR